MYSPDAERVVPFMDAMRIEFGPRAILERYFRQAADRLAARGITLYLSRDVGRLDKLGPDYDQAKPARFPAMDAALAGFGPDSWFTLEGRDASLRIAFVSAARLLRLRTNFRDELESLRLFYWDPKSQRDPLDAVEVTAPSAASVTHFAALQGCFWVNPALRGRGMIQVFPTLCRWYCCALWDVDYAIGFMRKDQAERGLARLYREPAPERWVRFQGRWRDDSYFVCNPRAAIEADMARQAEAAPRITRANELLETNRVPSTPRQGRISRS
jgi:hypothetical protein